MHIPKKRVLQQGLSVIELLIGVAVGLFILSGALMLFSDYINNNRRLVLETRVNQDMRAAADLVARDLRRAGYWGNANIPASVIGGASSPYAAVSPAGTASSSTVTYSYSQGTENNGLDSNENFGFRLHSNGELQYQQSTDNGWQAITDRSALEIQKFTVTPKHMCVRLNSFCSNSSSTACDVCAIDAGGCPTATCATCPMIKVRRYEIELTGKSATDAAVVRNLKEIVRVRNEEILGSCPL